MAKVVIMCGIPGSGKTTLVTKMYPKACVYSADKYFITSYGEYKFDPSKLSEAHGMCLRGFTAALICGEPLVVVDNTNTTVIEIAPYAALALAYGYELTIKVLKVDSEVAAARNVHGVPVEGVRKMAKRLEGLTKLLPPWWPCVVETPLNATDKE